MLAITEGTWLEAVQQWRSAISRSGNCATPEAFVEIAMALSQRRALPEADEILTDGQLAHPNNKHLAMEAAEVAFVAGDWSAAGDRWQAVLERFTNRAPAHAYASLARVRRLSRDYELAKSTIATGTARYPNDMGLAIESVEIDASRRDWQAAIQGWRALLSRFDREVPPRVHASLASACRREGDLAAAEQAVERGRETFPRNAELAIQHAELASAKEEWREAIDRWQAAADLGHGSQSKRALIGLSEAYHAIGDFAAAEDAMLRSRLMDLDSADTGKGGAHIERAPARAACRALPKIPATNPLVSIIVLTRDGRSLIDSMLRSFLATNSYSAFEFMVVDHGSTDGTLELLDRWKEHLPVRVLSYETNNSFSFGNNRAAEIANGELLLLLNNDVVFSGDLIGRMVAALEKDDVGAVGVKQYPGTPNSTIGRMPYHIGVRFAWDQKARFLRPYNVIPGATDDIISNVPAAFPAVTGSALMCRKEEYLNIGGLSEEYLYGFEDVDFCAKVRFILGKDVVSLNDVCLFHDESRSRRTTDRDERRSQRTNNLHKLKSRFGHILRRSFRETLPSDDGSQSGKRFTVGFAVTSTEFSRGAGDLFTALGLANALRRAIDCEIRYLSEPEWYDAEGLDLYVAMRNDVDISRLANASPHLVKIAWARNWIDRWGSSPWLEEFDLHLCSSKAGAGYLGKRLGIEPEVFPIGAATEVFSLGASLPEYETDCVFTGNHWGARAHRDIEDIDLSALDCRFSVYGKNWHRHRTLSSAHRGFLSYEELPRVYNSAKITVDDSAHHTKRWGSLNSRVFEALAAGSLVLTNNAVGSREIFDGRLPVWNNAQELVEQIKFYLNSPQERTELLQSLREQVLAEHSFERRAEKLVDFVAVDSRRLRIAIKCPAPRKSEAHFWGDYHLARSLAKSLRRLGYRVRIDLLPDWEGMQTLGDDVVIVLRGLSAYRPSADQINLCWLISHPAKVTDQELEQYDHVFVASESYAEVLSARLSKPVTSLLQCSDPAVFHPSSPAEPANADEILFVGNSRRQRRKIVDDALAANLPIAVYGREWDGIIDQAAVRAQLIENQNLHEHYGTAKIVLNDHWPDMAANGFVSNRIFDVALSGGFVISDDFVGKELFGDAITTYHGPDELRQVCERWLADDEGRKARAERLRGVVLSAHTFDHRAAVLEGVIAELAEGRMRGPADTPLHTCNSLDSKNDCDQSTFQLLGPDTALIVTRLPHVERLKNAIATAFSRVKDGEIRYMRGALYSEEGSLVSLSQRVSGIAGDVMRLDDPTTTSEKPTESLSGRGLYLGHLFGHYGHFITEGLGALWPVVDGETFDYYAMHPFIFGRKVLPYAQHVFDALGIPASAVKIIRRPIAFEDITIPERAWSVNRSVNAAFRRVIDRLARPAPGQGQPLYLSRRRIENRKLANEAQVEAIFASRGFRIVYPEELTFSEQLELYGRTSVIAGFDGSQLHNVMFCKPEALVIWIGHEGRPLILTNQLICNALTRSSMIAVPFRTAENGFDVSVLEPVFETLGDLSLGVARRG